MRSRPSWATCWCPSPRADGTAIACETDRRRFFGRRGGPRRPAALGSGAALSGTTGATLDPIFALGQEVALDAHQSLTISYVTLAAPDREALLELAARYQSPSATARAFQEAELAAQSWLGGQDVDAHELRDTLQVLSALLYPNRYTRTAPETMAANRLGQAGLWRFGISGGLSDPLGGGQRPRRGRSGARGAAGPSLPAQ